MALAYFSVSTFATSFNYYELVSSMVMLTLVNSYKVLMLFDFETIFIVKIVRENKENKSLNGVGAVNNNHDGTAPKQELQRANTGERASVGDETVGSTGTNTKINTSSSH